MIVLTTVYSTPIFQVMISFSNDYEFINYEKADYNINVGAGNRCDIRHTHFGDTTITDSKLGSHLAGQSAACVGLEFSPPNQYAHRTKRPDRAPDSTY